MKIKKIFLSLFVMIAGLFLIGNVNAVEQKEVYTIEIDEDGNMYTLRTYGDDFRDDYEEKDGIYNIDSGKIIYNSNTHVLEVSKGVIIDKITSELDLTITTNNEEAYIDYIYVGNKTEADLYIKNAKLSYNADYKNIVSGYNATNILIQKSTLSVSDIDVVGYVDLFVEESTVKAKNIEARGGALKFTNSKFEGLSISSGQVWSERTEGSIDWKTADKYVFKGGNGSAFYGVLIIDSEVTLVGEDRGGKISGYRGVLIENSKITDNSNSTVKGGERSIYCNGASGADITDIHREITINKSEVDIKGRIFASRYVDVVINNSKVSSDINVVTVEGMLNIDESDVSLKSYDASDDSAESPIAINGDITISNSKVITDASSTNGKVVAVAYSGKINLKDNVIAINEEGTDLIKDIDISDITYNTWAFHNTDKIYTIGLKNSDGTVSGKDSDYAVLAKSYVVTVSIDDGTWADGTTEDKVIKKIYGDTLTESDLPSGMKSSNGSTSGSWNVSLPIKLTKDMNITYKFDSKESEKNNIENPDTSDNMLLYVTLGLISSIGLITIKTLKKRYN